MVDHGLGALREADRHDPRPQSPKFHKTGRQLGSRSTLNSLPASCASRVVADLVAILG